MNLNFNHDIETRISILEYQVNKLTESINNINRRLSHESLLKRLIYYVIIGIIYFINKELESNISFLKSNNWWIINIIICLFLVVLRKPIMWFIRRI